MKRSERIPLLKILILVGIILMGSGLPLQSHPAKQALAGGLSWAGLFMAHLHPALALAFIVPFLPHPPG